MQNIILTFKRKRQWFRPHPRKKKSVFPLRHSMTGFTLLAEGNLALSLRIPSPVATVPL